MSAYINNQVSSLFFLSNTKIYMPKSCVLKQNDHDETTAKFEICCQRPPIFLVKLLISEKFCCKKVKTVQTEANLPEFYTET